ESAAPTRFLALDKPIPRRHFIQALELDIAPDAEMKLSYDPSWLAILRSTDGFTSISRSNTFLPSTHCEERSDFRPTESELAAIAELGDLTIPENFRQTAPPLKEDTPKARLAQSSPYYRNPQTAEFCSWLGISDLNKMLAERDRDTVAIAHYMMEKNCADTSEITIDDDDIFADGEDFAIDTRPMLGNFEDSCSSNITSDINETADSDGLLDFTPPKIIKKDATPASDGAIILKRRKVDISEDD
ncbi:DBR1 domain-containing protein, partial [Trichostrongylus colubriformis]